MKHRTHKLAAKAVAAILCAALMLTACGSKETANTETTSVESTEMTTTEAAVAEPTAEPAETPTESEAAPTETPAESPAPAVEPTAEPVVTETTTVADAGYTYSELNQTMYAKSAVNIRDLPNTDGKKIGSLKASQEITVTGKCDQTGWYRFDWNNTTGYVSNKYIVSEKPAVNTVAANATTAGNSNTAGNTTQQNTAAPAATPVPAQTTTTGNSEPYFDRAIAEQVFALVNEERVANGIPALTWSEDVYNIAVQRCYEGAAGDIHGMARNGTSENRTEGQMGDGGAQEIYQSWYNSPGHHNNYLNATYTSSAVAVYAQPCPIEGFGGPATVVYQVFTWDNTATNSSVTINTPVQDGSVAAAPKTADENTDTSSSNVGWSMTPPTQEDGLKKWQEQNPDAEVSFGN